jgi:antitoxin MazE
MKAQVTKWGNSLAVRIPGTYAKEMELEEGSELELKRVKGGLLLQPRRVEFTLEELMEQVTPENIHAATDWGAPAGREVW